MQLGIPFPESEGILKTNRLASSIINSTTTTTKYSQQQQQQQQKKQLLPCYSDKAPPECGSLVVFQIERVDDQGVWGELPDWCQSAYLPLGSVTSQRGRRKEQAQFLTRARRFVAKGKPLKVVAEVDSVEETSSTGVDQIFDPLTGDQNDFTFQISLTRYGVTKQEESDTLETSRQIQLCASNLVDKAANHVGVSCKWARNMALYEPYRRSLRGSLLKADSEDYGSNDQRDDGCQPVPPSRAPARFLLEGIGNLPKGAQEQVLDLLSMESDNTLDKAKQDAFAAELLILCRAERKRQSKPMKFSHTASIADYSDIAALLGKGMDAERVCDVSMVQSVILAVTSSIKLPPGFSNFSITVGGAGKYCFDVKGPKDEPAVALSFLESAAAKARSTWMDTATMPDNKNKTPMDSVSKRDDTIAANDQQPDLNVGMIGDVAHGKSSLIRAMSGKRTQAHSSEQQQHGITIRLGFANAAIIHCNDACGSYSFRPEEQMSNISDIICKKCGGPADVVRRVSFIDCPGHAELMATMLSGASAFDAVICAAASIVPCPSPQAKQHLEALKVSKSLTQPGRIAIAQTKSELMAQKADKNPNGLSAEAMLALHTSNSKEALQNTAACAAPFFPVCSPLDLGLEPLAAWLARFPSRQKSVCGTAHRIFNVLRSFDVNRPGKSYKDLVGGVIGGTIRGSGVIRPGDPLEVRPGLVVGTKKTAEGEKVFNVRPLQCRAVELMTGKTQLSLASAGGLVAIRTTLSPSLCADDRLVGAVAGPSEMLPPVWGPTLLFDKLQLVQIDTGMDQKARPKDRLKSGTKIKCHAGSATVNGKVIRVSVKRGKLEVELKSPLCAYQGSSVAIESELPGRSGFGLIAHASLFGGTCCCDGASAPTENPGDELPIEDEWENSEYNDEEYRVRFLDELNNKSCSNDDGIRVSVPRPELTRDGGAHFVIENFSVIAGSLKRDAAHLQSYLEREGGLSCARAGKNGFALRVRWRRRGGLDELLLRIIKRYATTFVACHECKSAKTELLKTPGSNNTTELCCRQCNARRFVAKS